MKTLLEKLDRQQHNLTLRESICNQVQRIIATRTHLGTTPEDNSCVTGFGIPEIISKYSGDNNQLQNYLKVMRSQILKLEPRLTDVQVIGINKDETRGHCRLQLTVGNETATEIFYF